MALLWVDGFDNYGTSTGVAPSPTNIVGGRYEVVDEDDLDTETGRNGTGYSLEFATGAPSIKTPVLTANDTVIIGVAFQIRTNNVTDILSLYDGSTEGVNVTFFSNTFTIRRGVTTLGTGSFNIGLFKWYWLELKVKCNGATGTYDLRIGETSIASDTGLNTKAGANNFHDKVLFGNSASDFYRIDDLYICDASGASNNDFLGNVKVTDLRPDGAGNTTEFTPLAGANYLSVDEQLIDKDTTYVESSTSTNKDTYTYDNITATNIKGIEIITCCRESDASAFSLINVTRSGGTDYDSSSQAIGGTDYVFRSNVIEQDPNTAAAWTDTNLNAAEFGIKVA